MIHVGRLESRPFTDDDVRCCKSSPIASPARQARLLAARAAAAALLERSLVPGALRRAPGSSSQPGTSRREERAVGGDWYDVFTLPSGELWIVVGDVAGHGLQAAVVMGRIRSACSCAYSLVGRPPEEVLDLVDRKVEHFEMGTFATRRVRSDEPPYDRGQVAVAGHLPPVGRASRANRRRSSTW